MSTPPDPSTWAALAHRVLSNWRPLLLLLIALAAVAAIAGTMVYLLGMSTVRVGPVVFERVPLIGSMPSSAPHSALGEPRRDVEERSTTTTLAPASEAAAT